MPRQREFDMPSPTEFSLFDNSLFHRETATTRLKAATSFKRKNSHDKDLALLADRLDNLNARIESFKGTTKDIFDAAQFERGSLTERREYWGIESQARIELDKLITAHNEARQAETAAGDQLYRRALSSSDVVAAKERVSNFLDDTKAAIDNSKRAFTERSKLMHRMDTARGMHNLEARNEQFRGFQGASPAPEVPYEEPLLFYDSRDRQPPPSPSQVKPGERDNRQPSLPWLSDLRAPRSPSGFQGAPPSPYDSYDLRRSSHSQQRAMSAAPSDSDSDSDSLYSQSSASLYSEASADQSAPSGTAWVRAAVPRPAAPTKAVPRSRKL